MFLYRFEISFCLSNVCACICEFKNIKTAKKNLNFNRTALTNHAISIKHGFDFERATIQSFEPFYKKRIINEMTHLKADK